MQIINLDKIIDGKVRAWVFDLEYKGSECKLMAYVDSNGNDTVYGWHCSRAIDKKDTEQLKEVVGTYIKENEFKSPELAFVEELWKGNAFNAMRHVALANDDRDLFEKYCTDKGEE